MGVMAKRNVRRDFLFVVGVIVIVAIVLLLGRCMRKAPVVTAPPVPTPATASNESAPAAAVAQEAAKEPDEVLGEATVKSPAKVDAGAAFKVDWTGPDNRGDYVTIVRGDAAAEAHGDFAETKDGSSLELTAPIEAGVYEVRYVTGRSRTVLARAAIEVIAVSASLEAAEEVTLGSAFPVAWKGPDNQGDYITIVAKDAPDEKYGSYENTAKGSPVTLTAPTVTGELELRYVSGQGKKALGRRGIKVIGAEVMLSAAVEGVAGSTIDVVWKGPNNAGDYVTVVAAGTPDGQYGNYANVSGGTPLKLLLPIMDGKAELRYMTVQGARVLARRAIMIRSAKVTLSALTECAAGAEVSITWTGPNHPGDYITIVAKDAADGKYGDYQNTTSGSPLSVNAPKEAGDAEVRYVTGQGGKVLARLAIQVVP